MYNYFLHQQAEFLLKKYKIDTASGRQVILCKASCKSCCHQSLHSQVYLDANDEKFSQVLETIIRSYETPR